jgi:hypothetical protein
MGIEIAGVPAAGTGIAIVAESAYRYRALPVPREIQIALLQRTGDPVDQADIDLGMTVELSYHVLDESGPIARIERLSKTEQFRHGVVADGDRAPSAKAQRAS